MRIGSTFLRPLTAAMGVACSVALGACQLLDFATLEPRTYEVNLGTQNVREELILLNVVRASRFEPLNFTALSKYTATGSLSATGGVTNNIGVDFAKGLLPKAGLGNNTITGQTPQTALTAGGTGQTGNSFDLVPLDNQDFYATFLAPLTPEKIYLLVNAGLSREVVFNSLIKAIDVHLTARGKERAHGFATLRYSNDLSDDTWFKDDSPAAFDQCKLEADADFEAAKRINHNRWAPFYTGFWYGEHLSDCKYHKFSLLLRAAFEYGVTTRAYPKNPKTEVMRVNQINVTVSTSTAEKPDSKNIILCFDPALAADYGHPITKAPCSEKIGKGPLRTELGEYDASVEPVMASAYGVFQYYGQLLRSARQVQLTGFAQRRTRDAFLFRVTPDLLGCFAHVNYATKSYCVPSEDAGNTKEVLTLLIALVNLSTSRSSLPVTPSVLVNP